MEDIALGYSNIFFWKKGWAKTQTAVILAYQAHLRGEIVISNIWLGFPHIRFRVAKDLPPILREIATYCNENVMAVEAPSQMLAEYGMKRKTMKLHSFFLLFDEIGNHLNNRNWNTNFKEPLMRDMLTEPRKYKMTIVGITQSTEDVDIAFLRACEDWFMFNKIGWKYFQKYVCHHVYVLNGHLNLTDTSFILETTYKFVYFWKLLHSLYRKLYWTGEIVWAWRTAKVPHMFAEWVIYRIEYASELETKALKNEWSDSEANMGVEGVTPSNNFSTSVIPRESLAKNSQKTRKRWRPRKVLTNN